MRKYLFAAVAALALGGSANAAAICGPARVDVGNPGRNGVVSTYVAHDPNGTWTIKHTLANGAVIDRSLQYAITDYTSRNALQWRGTLMRNASMTMVGEAMKLTTTGQPTYDEWLYQNGQLIMHSVALCQFDTPPTAVAQPSLSAPTSVAPAPVATPISAPVASAPMQAGEDSVGLINFGKGMMAQVTLGTRPVAMIVDTGATDMLVPAKLADQLVADGEASASGNAGVQQADGSTRDERVIVIHSLTIGRHTIREVPASVAPDGPDAMGLLPFPVLNRAGRFTVDTINNKLIFG